MQLLKLSDFNSSPKKGWFSFLPKALNQLLKIHSSVLRKISIDLLIFRSFFYKRNNDQISGSEIDATKN